ncbi:TATA box-binding protein-associated factor RNA polymerase I subunit B [Fopius arisanus]|uniref:TATA box-binding protein-associated factor RNA polymerase I subunit B n=1 Tax=Fopius arisanus TaxID=64838 RepID=A0A9R1T5Y2_9HYME|nr:PREDICTED: TATA box-binding protein-associated factor RNA polymerase I subunit B [Fopius arisanus]XP_011303404.1 PREDICTED: TATA box-binding protein-associated factor RNA polymerase I subunit B [Fopius arisanus]
MDPCVVCGGFEFYTESGFYFCQQCETQQEGRREEVVEYAADASTHVTKKRIDRRTKVNKTETSLGWTSWESFNFILNGWTNELLILGASPEFKITVLQLWATYLGKLQVAFRSFKERCLPRLPLSYRQKDSEIVFGVVPSKVKKRKRTPSNATSDAESTQASEMSFGRLLSQRRKKLVDLEYQKYLDTSESETGGASSVNQSLHSIKSDVLKAKRKKVPLYFNSFARAHKKKVTKDTRKIPRKRHAILRQARLDRHRKTAEHLTMQHVMAVINLALRVNDEKIFLSDILRFQTEGHISTKKLDHFFPEDEPIPKDLSNCGNSPSKYESLWVATSELAHLLEVSEIPEPNIVELIRRYCTDLQLPTGIALYAERMIALSPPKLTFESWNRYMPRYEAKAMAAIIMVMKILFGLDGVTECEISHVIDIINQVAEEKDRLDCKLFSFTEWQRYIECRRTVLINYHSATRFKLDPEVPSRDVNEYLDYLTKFVGPASLGKRLHGWTESINMNMDNLAQNLPETKPVRSFEPSLTPMHSYLQELLVDDEVDLPSVLRQDFTCTKVGYMTNTNTVKELADECGIDLEIVESSANFLERIVPIFDEAMNYPKTEDLSKLVPVVIHTRGTNRLDDPLEYLHRKNAGKINIDEKKKKLYEKNLKNLRQAKNQTVDDYDDFAFDQVFSDGKLNIEEFEYSDSEDEDPQLLGDENLLLSKFERESLKGGGKSHWHMVRVTKRQQQEEESYLNAKIKKKTKLQSPTSSRNCDCVMCAINTCPEHDSDPGPREPHANHENYEKESEINDSDELTIIGEVPTPRSQSDEEISIVKETKRARKKAVVFRPYRDYWLRRKERSTNINGSLVEWHRLERDFPVNFRWLLNECAAMIELESSSLYRELLTMEEYYADCLVQDYDRERACKFFYVSRHRFSTMVGTTRSKWNNVYKRGAGVRNE